MSDIVLSVENVSKLYRLGEIGTGTISHDLNRWLAKIRGKEDPFSKIGAVNDRTQKAESNFAWALKDINFQVKEGEVLGIIGKNGAGKSTLLKLISRITSPTTGSIKVKGRIASLLEVGTGMHPEMTARENIYLNGAIMGMTKIEIKKKFDEIIDFAGCTMYVDTPVKRFSSGMRVRLGFAVAAFLEPEILIVDEVLAVGDAEFQKKAIGKMQDVSKSEGRTVLFVSHNMAAVESLCTKGLLLNSGMIHSVGRVNEIIENYILLTNTNNSKDEISLKLNNLFLSNFLVSNGKEIFVGDELKISFNISNDGPKRSFYFNFDIKNYLHVPITHLGNEFINKPVTIDKDENLNIEITIGSPILLHGLYYVNFYLVDTLTHDRIYKVDFFDFQIIEKDYYGHGKLPRVEVHGNTITNPRIDIIKL
jgi:lipopolysaccharide transport system ATP-binding protein